MRYLKKTFQIILFSLITMQGHGMEPHDDKVKGSLKAPPSSQQTQEILRQLERNGSKLFSSENIFHKIPETPYFTAVHSGNVEVVKTFYKNTPYFFTQQDSSGFNALHIAANEGYLSIAEFLMEKDKRSLLQAPIALGLYPIHFAAKYNHVSILKLICEKNKKNVIQKEKTYLGTALHMACANGAKETVDYLMNNYPGLLKEKCKLGNFPHDYAQLSGHHELAKSVKEAHQKLFENTQNVPVVSNNQNQKQVTRKPTKQSKRKPQKQKNKKSPQSPVQKQDMGEVVTVLAPEEAVSPQAVEESPAGITQETQIYTKMGLKKTSVEDIKRIYEKTLVKGEIYEINPSKEKMILHILKHQNTPKIDVSKEIPQILVLDVEQAANDHTSLSLFDAPKEKPKRKIRIQNPLAKLSKKAEDWKARQTETREEKAARKRVRNQGKIIDFNGDGKSFEASTISQSMGDLKSHFSITDSESQSMKSFVSQSEGEIGDIAFEMKLSYPQLFNLLKKVDAQHISEVKFKSSNIIRATLTIMKEHGFIDGTIGKANIHVTRKNSTEPFVSHTTHGSSKYARWYHNPAIVVNFLEFISKSDPVIRAYLESIFAENCFSRDVLRVTEDAKKPVDTNPNEAGED